MIATRDFRYFDHVQQKSVEVKAGQDVPAETMGRQKVDVEKLVRTKFLVAKDGEGFGEDLTPRSRGSRLDMPRESKGRGAQTRKRRTNATQ